MPAFSLTIDHRGESLDVEVSWGSVMTDSGGPAGFGDEGTGLEGLHFDVHSIDDRDPTEEEVERLDEELTERYDKDDAFQERIGTAINEHGWDD